MSRVVSLRRPHAHALTGLANRFPAHQSGYSPVRWQVSSNEPQVVLLYAIGCQKTSLSIPCACGKELRCLG